MKQATEKGKDLITLSVKVPRSTADAFRDVAESEFRPMAAELRMLIEGHVKNYNASSRTRRGDE